MHFLFKIPSLEKGVKKYQKNLMGQSNYTPSFEENTINNHDNIPNPNLPSFLGPDNLCLLWKIAACHSIFLTYSLTLLTHDNLPKMASNDLKLPSKDLPECKIKFQLGSLFYSFLI